jgi:hypothetical protein
MKTKRTKMDAVADRCKAEGGATVMDCKGADGICWDCLKNPDKHTNTTNLVEDK